MHFIQKSILDALRQSESLHYAELNVLSVESGHFRYHLSQLVKEGHVEQLQRGIYALTTTGKAFVDELSLGKIKPSKMPKVITYTLLQDGHKLLLQKKQKAPYRGLFNMIGGKVHLGEPGVDASVREVFEKTGIVVSGTKSCGSAEIMIYKDEVLLSHVVALLFSVAVDATAFTDTDIDVFETGELATHKADLAPDLLQVYELINSPVSGNEVPTIKIII